uniref:Uncharacterized protein n=1 Tax=Pseudictyota dubia TaxID=2749911 RepID=A0A7R9WAM3_9STRA|mmetsp:Transcript_40785/g.75481  ORF Transcript_40785/g.75481 Transcript_40785/m.75481 type:complete len:325 (+) Transcript_40785:202-1176(+)|eukprot:CAMPEP_0197464070 /NCGR_PEP_ID=MMETSP1175-20131217/63521_1 /TAXON_ID=1003142 /ORGANISM="Triceratium dubium, Strain CCMP147" /LENGTH=324 /DNA_ID=CAMNT_0042999987 /DNA_START=195 /DNA_END=1169 /DNA_ORIENTATION=-
MRDRRNAPLAALFLSAVAVATLGSVEAECTGYAGSCGSKFSSGSCRSLGGCSWSSVTEMCSGSPPSCSSRTSESSCTGGFGHSCFWNDNGDDTEDSPSAEESECGGRGSAFESKYLERFGDYDPLCVCSDGGESLTCRDRCKRCNSQGVCAKSWKSEYYTNDEHYGATWTSYLFDVEDSVDHAKDGHLFVRYYLYPVGTPPGNLCDFRIGEDTDDGQSQKCKSCLYKQCILTDARRGFDLDCSNLGYGATIDTCDETSNDLEYPFRLLNGMERFSLMNNAEPMDCTDASSFALSAANSLFTWRGLSASLVLAIGWPWLLFLYMN